MNNLEDQIYEVNELFNYELFDLELKEDIKAKLFLDINLKNI